MIFGEPVEYFVEVNSPFGLIALEKGSFVAFEGQYAIVKTQDGKHKKLEKERVYAYGKPYVPATCSKCNTKGKWVDHGHMVGKGWYCTVCKVDIVSSDNVYGITGRKSITKSNNLDMPDTLNKSHAPTNNPFLAINKKQHIDCRYNGTAPCPACYGLASFNLHLNLVKGDVVQADNVKGTKGLTKGATYMVEGFDHNSLSIIYDAAKPSKNFLRCRFFKL